MLSSFEPQRFPLNHMDPESEACRDETHTMGERWDKEWNVKGDGLVRPRRMSAQHHRRRDFAPPPLQRFSCLVPHPSPYCLYCLRPGSSIKPKTQS